MFGKFFKLFGLEVLLVLLPLGLFLVLDLNRVTGAGVILLVGFLVAYVFFLGFLFFYLPTIFLSFKPQSNVLASRVDVQKVVADYFLAANTPRGTVFDVVQKRNRVIVTWSGELAHNQLINIGEYGKKAVFFLDFDEKSKSVFLSQSERHFNWDANLGGFYFSTSYFRGITLEYEATYKPSFAVIDGRLRPQLVGLRYNTMEILGPIRQILSNNGWRLRFSIFGPTVTRVTMWLFLGLATLVIAATLIVYLV